MAKAIDEKTLLRVASIARLKLTEEEVKKLTKQMQNVLDAFKVLDEVNTEKVEPSFHPFEIKNIFREDTLEKCFTIEETLENAKHKEDRHFKGPRIV